MRHNKGHWESCSLIDGLPDVNVISILEDRNCHQQCRHSHPDQPGDRRSETWMQGIPDWYVRSLKEDISACWVDQVC